jgi:hypothetical protein
LARAKLTPATIANGRDAGELNRALSTRGLSP